MRTVHFQVALRYRGAGVDQDTACGAMQCMSRSTIGAGISTLHRQLRDLQDRPRPGDARYAMRRLVRFRYCMLSLEHVITDRLVRMMPLLVWRLCHMAEGERSTGISTARASSQLSIWKAIRLSQVNAS